MSSGKEKAKSNRCSVNNIFTHHHKSIQAEETFEQILSSDSFTLERIISSGQTTPADQPYRQKKDEWVLLLQGEAVVETEQEKFELKPGDYLHIPLNTRHWITYTSQDPECIWLALHGNFHPAGKTNV